MQTIRAKFKNACKTDSATALERAFRFFWSCQGVFSVVSTVLMIVFGSSDAPMVLLAPLEIANASCLVLSARAQHNIFAAVNVRPTMNAAGEANEALRDTIGYHMKLVAVFKTLSVLIFVSLAMAYNYELPFIVWFAVCVIDYASAMALFVGTAVLVYESSESVDLRPLSALGDMESRSEIPLTHFTRDSESCDDVRVPTVRIPSIRIQSRRDADAAQESQPLVAAAAAASESDFDSGAGVQPLQPLPPPPQLQQAKPPPRPGYLSGLEKAEAELRKWRSDAIAKSSGNVPVPMESP